MGKLNTLTITLLRFSDDELLSEVERRNTATSNAHDHNARLLTDDELLSEVERRMVAAHHTCQGARLCDELRKALAKSLPRS